MAKLSGKTALITGGSSGIGQAIALTYADAGAKIVFSYLHHRDEALKTIKQIKQSGGQAELLQADLSIEQDIKNLFQESIQILGRLDILVNNAGIVTRHTHFTEISSESFEKVYTVNLKAPFLLTQLAAKHMQTEKIEGSILNISSMSAEITSPGLTHYECSKAALNALTRGAASELAHHHIRVNGIAPGLVATHINQEQRLHSPETWTKRVSTIPLGRVGSPKDIAALALFLGSDEAAWITGSIFGIDGGLSVKSPFG